MKVSELFDTTQTKRLTEGEWQDQVDERILRAVREMGFSSFSPIQEQAIPSLLAGEDMIGQAQTGTGKTAAFGIPALQKINPELKRLQCVILCPTRELAIQAAEELRKIAKYMHGIKILPVYGGQEISKQISGLRGVQIIVGTPGRVMDHMRRHTIRLEHVSMVVLDEADEMLNMGFREDMELILGQIPGDHQTALFSATMPKPILDITGQFQKDARLIRVAAKELTIPLVAQRYYKVRSQDKDAACIRLLEYYQPTLCLIFCNTKVRVDELSEVLKKAGFCAEGLHGDMSQHQRDVAMNRFRGGITNILIATDVAARGIDVDNVEAVINYDIPQDVEYYVHRIGRTGRAGKTGRSFTFASAREMYRIREIEKICNTKIEERKLPGAARVLKVKADKYLSKTWELHEHEDMELMKGFLLKKMEEENCEALDLAAAMLKFQVGEKGPEIEVDRTFGRERFGDRQDLGRRRSFGRNRDSEGKAPYGKRFRDGENRREARKYPGKGERREPQKYPGEEERREPRKYSGEEERRNSGRARRENERSKTRAKDVRRDGSVREASFARPGKRNRKGIRFE